MGIVPQSPVRSDEQDEDLTLVPMGCARLRISVFPRVTSGPEARRWDPNPPLATASRAWHFMPPSAMNDGRVPSASSDRTVRVVRLVGHVRHGGVGRGPPSRGRVAWARWTCTWADEALTKSSGRVPSDVRLKTPTDGRVRLPASYRIEWWDGQAWQPVSRAPGSRHSGRRVQPRGVRAGDDHGPAPRRETATTAVGGDPRMEGGGVTEPNRGIHSTTGGPAALIPGSRSPA